MNRTERLLSERDRDNFGKHKKRFAFSRDSMRAIFNHSNIAIRPGLETTQIKITEVLPPYCFSKFTHPFNAEFGCKLEITDKTYTSVLNYVNSMMFKELCNVDPPRSSMDSWHLELIERGISTQDWEKWMLNQGLQHFQRAYLHRAGTSKTFRSLLVHTNSRLIVNTYRNCDFFGSALSSKAVDKWHYDMSLSHVSVTIPSSFPIRADDLCCVPRIGQCGYNVTGVMLMALREKLLFTSIDEIQVPYLNFRGDAVLEQECKSRPLTCTTRITGNKRLIHHDHDHQTDLGSTSSLNVPSKRRSNNFVAPRGPLHGADVLFRSGDETPTREMAGLGLNSPYHRPESGFRDGIQDSKSSASSVDDLNNITERMAAVTNDDDDDDDIIFDGEEINSEYVFKARVEDIKPDVNCLNEQIMADESTRRSLVMKFPEALNGTSTPIEQNTSLNTSLQSLRTDSGFSDDQLDAQRRIQSTSSLNDDVLYLPAFHGFVDLDVIDTSTLLGISAPENHREEDDLLLEIDSVPAVDVTREEEDELLGSAGAPRVQVKSEYIQPMMVNEVITID